jgi:hypothetical protein
MGNLQSHLELSTATAHLTSGAVATMMELYRHDPQPEKHYAPVGGNFPAGPSNQHWTASMRVARKRMLGLELAVRFPLRLGFFQRDHTRFREHQALLDAVSLQGLQPLRRRLKVMSQRRGRLCLPAAVGEASGVQLPIPRSERPGSSRQAKIRVQLCQTGGFDPEEWVSIWRCQP